MGCSYNGNTLGSHLSNPGSTPGLVHMADYHYPSAPKQYATMWWDMHGAGQVLMKVKVIRQRPDGRWECAKWNYPDIRVIADAADLSYTKNLGGLAHLVRALPWHGRGDRFDSDIFHGAGAGFENRPVILGTQ